MLRLTYIINTSLPLTFDLDLILNHRSHCYNIKIIYIQISINVEAHNERANESNEQTHASTSERTNERTPARANARPHEQANEQTNARPNERANEQTNDLNFQ